MKTLLSSTLALLVFVWLSFAQTPAVAQEASTPGQSLTPLENLLQPDGTLNLQAGFNGSLDPTGWRMVSEPGQSPRFVRSGESDRDTNSSALNITAAAIPGDALWDYRFNALGLNGIVRAIAVRGSDVYVGGSFNAAGTLTNTLNIARWNSAAGSWSALGGGVNGTVQAIAVSGNNVYVGGSFTTAGGVNANRIARWDDTTSGWSALGSGVNGTVYAIAVSGSEVYAGGSFIAAGGVPGVTGTRGIARWNGTNWLALGSGTTGTVNAIAVSGGDVYVGGSFTSAGGGVTDTLNIAKWNGTSWSALGSGTTGIVRAIVVSGSDVYVGGDFITAGGMSAKRIARWNGTSWSALGSGVNATVNAIAVTGTDVYVGGSFTTVYNTGDVPVSANRIARWNGAGWSALGGGMNSTVYSLGVGADGVYGGGSFTVAGGYISNRFGLWRTTIADPDNNWDANFGAPGANNRVYAIAVSGSDVYFGGVFTRIGDIHANCIARWNSATGEWSNMGGGVSYPPGYGCAVYAIAVNGNDVYVGGGFGWVGDDLLPVRNIARWNGAWFDVGRGVDGNAVVNAIAIGPDGVYVGGQFSIAYSCDPADPTCRVSVNHIAKWNSTTGKWSDVGGGVNRPSNSHPVKAIVVSGNDVYVGGLFSLAGGNMSANNIAKWDSATSTWSPLGDGVEGPYFNVAAIAVSGSDVYVGGNFIKAGGMPITDLARWNTTTGIWSQLGSGIDGAGVYAIAVAGNEVYAGGGFRMAGGVNTPYIAKWNSATGAWSPLGTGMNNGGRAIGIIGNEVYVGGHFNTAGGKPSNHIGLWHANGAPPPASGGISGHVTDPNSNPVPGAHVQVCRGPGGAPCVWRGSTDAQGNYQATGLTDGEYFVRAYPPGSVCLLPASIGPLTITNDAALTGQDIQLSAAAGPPPGTSIAPSKKQCFPSVDWSVPLRLTTQGCPGGSASYQILLGSTVLRSGPMTEISPGKYQATIAPFQPRHGYATVQITIQCPDGSTQTVTFTIYIDPSGHVRTVSGAPIEGATVTLFYFDNGIGDFAVVPNGEALMSPANRANPDLTDADGHFGWDVIAGFYKVRAEKTGCVSPADPSQTYVESDFLVIPPPITDLDLRLNCGGNSESTIYLPLIVKEN